MRSYLRTLCVLALMLGVGKAMAAAPTVDNLQMEVHVTIAGTHDVIWASGGSVTNALLGPAIDNGTNEFGAAPNDKVDNVATGSNGSSGAAASDLVRWEITNALLGQVRATHNAAPAGSDAAVDFYLDNVGNKKVDVTAFIATIAAADSAAAPTPKWAIDNAPGTSTFRLRIKATDSGANTGDPVNAASAIANAQIPNFLTGYADLGPIVAGTPDVPPVVPLVNGWKRFQNHLSVDLEYSTPTDVGSNAEFDNDHITTITISTTAN